MRLAARLVRRGPRGLRLPLDADPEALALGDVVFFDRALDRFLAGPSSDSERHALGVLAAKPIDAATGKVSRGHSWPILLKKFQVEARCKSAQIVPTSEIDD